MSRLVCVHEASPACRSGGSFKSVRLSAAASSMSNLQEGVVSLAAVLKPPQGAAGGAGAYLDEPGSPASRAHSLYTALGAAAGVGGSDCGPEPLIMQPAVVLVHRGAVAEVQVRERECVCGWEVLEHSYHVTPLIR
jgi:hypothetical protein